MSQSSKVFLEDCFCLSSSLAAIDYTNTTNLLYSLFNCVSDYNFTYCSSPEELQGGEGQLQSCDRLLIHITTSVDKFTCQQSPTIKHFHTISSSSKGQF